MALTGLGDNVKDSQCAIADYPDAIAKIKELRDQIVSGALVIEDPMKPQVEPVALTVLELEATGIVKRYGSLARERSGGPRRRTRRDPRGHGGERRRQVDADVASSTGCSSRTRGRSCCAASEVRFHSALDAIAARHGDGPPGLQALQFTHRFGEHHLSARSRSAPASSTAARARRRVAELAERYQLVGRPGRSRRNAFGRRAPACRNPEGALSRRPNPDPRRADCGSDAAGARRAVRRDEASCRRRADDPFRHPQDPRGDGGHRPGDRAPRRTRGRNGW